jgi:hypothetical protein
VVKFSIAITYAHLSPGTGIGSHHPSLKTMISRGRKRYHSSHVRSCPFQNSRWKLTALPMIVRPESSKAKPHTFASEAQENMAVRRFQRRQRRQSMKDGRCGRARFEGPPSPVTSCMIYDERLPCDHQLIHLSSSKSADKLRDSGVGSI